MENKLLSIIIIGITLVVGIYIFSILNSSFFMEYDSYSKNSSSINLQSQFSLSPIGRGITSSSVQVYNQTWLDFNNMSGRINFDDNDIFSFTDNNYDMPLSMEIKFKINDSSQNQALLGKYSNPYEYYLVLTQTTLRPQLILRDNSAGVGIQASYDSGLNIGELYHLIVTYNGESGANGSNGINMYLNGIKLNLTKSYNTNYISMENTSSTFHVGARGGGLFNFSGNIYYVKMFNREIGYEEAIYRYNNSNVINISDINSFNYMSPTYKLIIPTTENKSFREIGNVLFNETGNNNYKLFFTEHNGTYTQNNTYIGWANSTDGDNWNYQGILNISESLEDPYVIYNGSDYLLYAEAKYQTPFQNISLYTSSNLVNWNKIGVILSPNMSWESQDVSSPTVIKDGSNYYMLYEGRNSTQNGMIGLATSNNGINWTKHANNPFIIQGNATSWESDFVVPDDIIKQGENYFITYHGNNLSIKAGLLITPNLTIKEQYKKLEINPIWTTDIMFLNISNKINLIWIGTNGIRKETAKFNSSIYENKNLIFDLKLNSNTGTTAYDSSGNGNNGVISGATWNNDGVLVSLVNGVDYTLNTATGLLTLGNSYLYDWVMIGWIYEKYTIKGEFGNTAIDNLIQGLESGSSFIIIILVLFFAGIIVTLLNKLSKKEQSQIDW